MRMSDDIWKYAPEGAQYYCTLGEPCWYKVDGLQPRYWETDNNPPSWADSHYTLRRVTNDIDFIPRPQSTQRLPEVGSKIEIKAADKWQVAEVLAHGKSKRDGDVLIFQTDDWVGCWPYGQGIVTAQWIRAIKSDRERQIEDALKVIDKADLATCEWQAHAERVIGSMVDAGYRRTP